MKYHFKLLTACLLILSFVSCEDDNGTAGYLISTHLDIFAESTEGEDLMDPSRDPHLTIGSVRVDYLVDGQRIREDGSIPIKIDGRNGIRVFANSDADAGMQTIYLTWLNTNEDIVKAEMDKGDGFSIVTKFWYNGELIYDGQDNDEASHTVVLSID